MKLYLVQHGDALSKEIDPERPLSEKGQHDVQKTANFLMQAGVRVQSVLHSGKTRAQQTAVTLARAVMPDGKVETVGGIAPNDDVAAFAATLESVVEDTFVVGHLPFMGRLVAYLLVGGVDREVVSYQPGSVVCLERTESATWHLNWMLRPELLG